MPVGGIYNFVFQPRKVKGLPKTVEKREMQNPNDNKSVKYSFQLYEPPHDKNNKMICAPSCPHEDRLGP